MFGGVYNVSRQYVPVKVEPNSRQGERRSGHLHPKAYLWVILEKWGKYYDSPPRHLLERYERACKIWGSTPHVKLAQWERKRFAANLAGFAELFTARTGLRFDAEVTGED